jgi:hypothetical protein
MMFLQGQPYERVIIRYDAAHTELNMPAVGQLQERTLQWPCGRRRSLCLYLLFIPLTLTQHGPWSAIRARTEIVRTGAGTHQFTSLGLALGFPISIRG